MNGSRFGNGLLITSAEYMSLKEQAAMLHGIKIINGIEQQSTMIITSLMIYLVNADQLHNNNTMIRT